MFTINIDPVAFTIGSIEIRWYGILIAIAVAVVILWLVRQIESLRKKGELPIIPDMMIAPAGIISGMIGAKLVHVFERWDFYIQNPTAIFSGGGFAVYGGILGATLGIWIYLKLTHQDELLKHFGFFIDLVTPGIILAQAIGRIGCAINGCCHGKLAPDWFPLSLVYTHPNTSCAFDLRGVPLYPTQPAETVFGLITFAILLKLRGRLKPDGSLFLVYLIMYSAWRLGIGYLRTDMQFIFGLSQAQIISLVVLVASIIWLVYMRRHFKVAEQPSG